MKFNVLERVMLMGVLPQNFNFADYRILNELKTALSFSEKEMKELGMTQTDDKVNWKVADSPDKEIVVGKRATEIVVAALKKLDEAEQLTEQLISLYEKFIVTETN
ncbi:MAG: hypothetical protein KKC55_17380 [Gammaproteobacteria bacterium]|nr:hypothetical protein [Gammaproteobacteria bacterium]